MLCLLIFRLLLCTLSFAYITAYAAPCPQEAQCVRLPGQCCFKKGKSCCAAPCPETCHSIYIPRSPHADSSYFLTHARYDLLEIMTSCLDFGYAYQRSFQGDNIATCMLGSPVLRFKGSQVADRDDELLADQFGLSPLFDGFVELAPRIVNHTFHLQGIWYSPPASRCEGLFIRGQLSVTHQTRSLFDLAACQDPFVTVTQGPVFPPGAMSDTSTQALSLREALSGTATFGQMQSPWTAGRFTADSLSATGISGATLDIGYAAIHHDIHAFSCFIRYRPATGTLIDGRQPYASSLFFPIIGDGHFHQLGVGASMSGQLWGDEDEDRAVVIHCEGYVVHLFENQQRRSFDLKGHGCLSKYLLLKRFDRVSGSPLSSLIPAVNITTRPVHVSVGAQGEVALQLLLRSHHSTITIGYEFYGKEQEKVCLIQDPFLTNSTAYGIKGCTGTTYFTYSVDGLNNIVAPTNPSALVSNATSSASSIRACGATDHAVSTQAAQLVGVDWTNPFTGNGELANSVTPGTAVDTLDIAFVSNPPVYLTQCDIDVCSGTAPKQIIHKGVLAYMYTWYEHRYTPYLAVGFEAEGSGNICSLKQYALWLKGGIAF